MKEKKYLHRTPYLFLFLLMVFFLSKHTPNTGYDTPSYVHFSIVRPPIYPLFIWLFHWAGQYQFQLVMWAQSILTFSALLYARSWFRQYFKIADFLIFFVFVLVLITICFHFQMWYIESEGLSFPFFIFTFFLLIECFQQVNLKKIMWLALWAGILILTRLQFYYFYGIFILLISYYVWKKIPLKTCGICVIVLLISIALTTLADKSYHYFKQGHFSSEPTSGVQFIIQPLFLADQSVVHYFNNQTEKTIFQDMLNKIKQQELNNNAILLKSLTPQYYALAYHEYDQNYLPMQAIVFKTFSKMSTLNENKITMNIVKILVLHQLKVNVYFYFWKIISSMGGVPPFLFFCLLLLATLFKIFKNREWNPDFTQLFVALVTVITFANAALVAVAEPACPPYFCYTQFLLYCLAALFSDRIFFKCVG